MDLIDIHTHILPGLDDGAQDLKQSLAMAEAAINDGVNLLVATPYITRANFADHKANILKHVETLNQCLEFARIKLPVLPGAEYRLEEDLPQRFQAGQLLTLNNTGRYMLISIPSKHLPAYTEHVLYSLQKLGVTPVIAHPEKHQVLAKDPTILQEFARRGILAQVMASSINGRQGRNTKKAALNLLETGSVQLIASEALPGEGRLPVLYTAFQEIERRLGAAMARAFISHNPYQVTQGLPIKEIPMAPRESLWQRFCKITEI